MLAPSDFRDIVVRSQYSDMAMIVGNAVSPWGPLPVIGRAPVATTAVVCFSTVATAPSDRGRFGMIAHGPMAGAMLGATRATPSNCSGVHDREADASRPCNGESLFATILLGRHTLAAKMGLGTLAALEQRITVRLPLRTLWRQPSIWLCNTQQRDSKLAPSYSTT